MHHVILSPREHHHARSLTELLALHAQSIQRKQQRGRRVRVHESSAPAVAYISRGSWVIDCGCGAGNAVEPSWDRAVCFECGAVHTHLVIPDDHEDIEHLILARPEMKTRNQRPGESLLTLALENAAHGVRW